MTELHLVADDDGVAEHRFELSVNGEQVPGLLWSAPGSAGHPALPWRSARRGPIRIR